MEAGQPEDRVTVENAILRLPIEDQLQLKRSLFSNHSLRRRRDAARDQLYRQLGALQAPSSVRNLAHVLSSELVRYQSSAWAVDVAARRPAMPGEKRALMFRILSLDQHILSNDSLRRVLGGLGAKKGSPFEPGAV